MFVYSVRLSNGVCKSCNVISVDLAFTGTGTIGPIKAASNDVTKQLIFVTVTDGNAVFLREIVKHFHIGRVLTRLSQKTLIHVATNTTNKNNN